MDNGDIMDGIIIGAAAAAFGTIIAMKFLNRRPEGGGAPDQVDAYSYTARDKRITTPDPVDFYPYGAAPNVYGVTPITQASYNLYPVKYAPAFGPEENQPVQEAVLPA